MLKSISAIIITVILGLTLFYLAGKQKQRTLKFWPDGVSVEIISSVDYLNIPISEIDSEKNFKDNIIGNVIYAHLYVCRFPSSIHFYSLSEGLNIDKNKSLYCQYYKYSHILYNTVDIKPVKTGELIIYYNYRSGLFYILLIVIICVGMFLFSHWLPKQPEYSFSTELNKIDDGIIPM